MVKEKLFGICGLDGNKTKKTKKSTSLITFIVGERANTTNEIAHNMVFTWSASGY